LLTCPRSAATKAEPYPAPVAVKVTSSPGSFAATVAVPIICPSDHPVTQKLTLLLLETCRFAEGHPRAGTDPKPAPVIVIFDVVVPAGQESGEIELIYGNDGTTCSDAVTLPLEVETVRTAVSGAELAATLYCTWTSPHPNGVTVPSVTAFDEAAF